MAPTECLLAKMGDAVGDGGSDEAGTGSEGVVVDMRDAPGDLCGEQSFASGERSASDMGDTARDPDVLDGQGLERTGSDGGDRQTGNCVGDHNFGDIEPVDQAEEGDGLIGIGHMTELLDGLCPARCGGQEVGERDPQDGSRSPFPNHGFDLAGLGSREDFWRPQGGRVRGIWVHAVQEGSKRFGPVAGVRLLGRTGVRALP